MTLHAPGQANNFLAVDMHLDSHNFSVNCTFLGSFQGVAYCEIKLIDPTFTHLEIGAQSQERASAGESVLINNITLKSSTVYHYNVSAVLEDESTPPVVVVWGSSPHHLQVSSVHGLHFIIFCILALEPLSNGLMTEVKFLRLIPKMR